MDPGPPFQSIGRLLLVAGVVLLVAGGLALLLGKAGASWPRLPGDFVWRTGRTTIFLPLTTSILLSLLLTLLLNLFFRR